MARGSSGRHSGRKQGGKATTKQGKGDKEEADREATKANPAPAQQRPRGANKKGQPGAKQ